MAETPGSQREKVLLKVEKKMQAMILAAGFGTRLRPYTLIKPKPLFPVLNRPLLHILLDMLERAGCLRVVVNAHHLVDQIDTALAEYPEVILQHEPEILGTGGSLRLALAHFIEEPLLVMNGDIFHNIDLARVYQNHRESGNLVTMAMHDHSRFNSVVVEGDYVRTFKPRDRESLLAFTGIHVLQPEVIRMIPETGFFHIIDLYEQLAGLGEQVGIVRVDGSYWRDIGTPEDYLHLHEELLTGIVPSNLPVVLPQTPWCIADGVEMAENVTQDDWGCIGSNATIGNNTHLARSVIWDGVNIPVGSRIADAIVTPVDPVVTIFFTAP
ncbi:MAG: NTP transferase domain-containing protein [Desulfobulbaceae bacterium]|nr:NTP transferase domain-containing protein [Desulfobulbaceae bacterium]